MLGLVGAFDRDAEVGGLLLRELGQLGADLLEVQTGDFFVEVLGQAIDADLVDVLVLPEIDKRIFLQLTTLARSRIFR